MIKHGSAQPDTRPDAPRHLRRKATFATLGIIVVSALAVHFLLGRLVDQRHIEGPRSFGAAYSRGAEGPDAPATLPAVRRPADDTVEPVVRGAAVRSQGRAEFVEEAQRDYAFLNARYGRLEERLTDGGAETQGQNVLQPVTEAREQVASQFQQLVDTEGDGWRAMTSQLAESMRAYEQRLAMAEAQAQR